MELQRGCIQGLRRPEYVAPAERMPTSRLCTRGLRGRQRASSTAGRKAAHTHRRKVCAPGCLWPLATIVSAAMGMQWLLAHSNYVCACVCRRGAGAEVRSPNTSRSPGGSVSPTAVRNNNASSRSPGCMAAQHEGSGYWKKGTGGQAGYPETTRRRERHAGCKGEAGGTAAPVRAGDAADKEDSTAPKYGSQCCVCVFD